MTNTFVHLSLLLFLVGSWPAGCLFWKELVILLVECVFEKIISVMFCDVVSFPPGVYI